jgi:hypothetical protein
MVVQRLAAGLVSDAQELGDTSVLSRREPVQGTHRRFALGRHRLAGYWPPRGGSPRPSLGPMGTPRTPKGRMKAIAARLSESTRRRCASSTIATRSSCWRPPCCRRRRTDARVNMVTPQLFARYPDAAALAAANPDELEEIVRQHRLLPEQGAQPDRDGPGAASSGSTVRCPPRSTIWSRWPAWVARPATSCAALRSGCRGSRSTRTWVGSVVSLAAHHGGRSGEGGDELGALLPPV